MLCTSTPYKYTRGSPHHFGSPFSELDSWRSGSQEECQGRSKPNSSVQITLLSRNRSSPNCLCCFKSKLSIVLIWTGEKIDQRSGRKVLTLLNVFNRSSPNCPCCFKSKLSIMLIWTGEKIDQRSGRKVLTLLNVFFTINLQLQHGPAS